MVIWTNHQVKCLTTKSPWQIVNSEIVNWQIVLDKVNRSHFQIFFLIICFLDSQINNRHFCITTCYCYFLSPSVRFLWKILRSKWWSQRDATSADTINAKRLHANKAVKEIPCLQNLSEWIWPVKLFISFKLTLPLTLYQSNLFIKYKLL